MPGFTEDFASIADWTEEAGSGGGHFEATTAPAGLVGVTTALKLTETPSSGTCSFAWSRLDLVDGGNPSTVYWITYAFYVENWADFDPGSGNYFLLPGFAFQDDPDFQNGNGNFATLKATSPSSGYFQGPYGAPSDEFAEGTWHTVRMGYLNDGITPLTESYTYFDDALLDFTTFPGAYTPVGDGGTFGPSVYDDQCDMNNAVVYIAQLNHALDVDPGEPAEIEPPVPPPGPGDEPGGGGGPPIPATGDTAYVGVYIDGVDVTGCVQSGSVTRTLNRPAQATMRLYSECASGDACSRAKVYIGGSLWFHGFVTQISTEAGEDGAIISEYTCLDPMMLWQWRPARDGPASLDPGDFSKPDFFREFIYGPQILEQILLQSEDDSDPDLGEGPLFIDLAGATYDTGVADLSGAPTDWPMTIAEVFELMSSTGTLDAVLSPIDWGGNMASLVVKNGDYGNDLTGSVAFEYATGDRNVKAVRMTEDSTAVCNKLWYYLGPRVGSAKDPPGDQHWRANITADDPGLPGAPSSPPQSDIIARRDASRVSCGVRMEVRIYDGQSDGVVDASPSAYRELYRRLWQMESWLRAIPRTLVHVTPVRTSEFYQLPPGVTPVQVGDFDIGDLVTVTAGAVVRGGFTGAQRIYSYTVSWDEDGIVELGELQTSADQEGIV